MQETELHKVVNQAPYKCRIAVLETKVSANVNPLNEVKSERMLSTFHKGRTWWGDRSRSNSAENKFKPKHERVQTRTRTSSEHTPWFGSLWAALYHVKKVATKLNIYLHIHASLL